MKKMENDIVHSIFGDEGSEYVKILNKVGSELKATKYSFMPIAQYRSLSSSNLPASMQVYWCEILYRAHFSASTSLLRSQRWISGILSAVQSKNILMFSACFRGFLESSADTNDSLAEVAYRIAYARRTIELALKKNLNRAVSDGELEDRLIHFTHARIIRKGESAPDSHRAKTATSYLKTLKRENDNSISKCYADLCEYTHPAFSSIMCFARIDETCTEYILDSNIDYELINELCKKYSAIMPDIMSLGIAPALAILAILNKFELRDLHTPYINSIDMSSWSAWQEVMNNYNKSKKPF